MGWVLAFDACLFVLIFLVNWRVSVEKEIMDAEIAILALKIKQISDRLESERRKGK